MTRDTSPSQFASSHLSRLLCPSYFRQRRVRVRREPERDSTMTNESRPRQPSRCRGAGLERLRRRRRQRRRRRPSTWWGYSVLQNADAGLIEAFDATDAGKDVEIKGSYGASGDQSRAVEAGPGRRHRALLDRARPEPPRQGGQGGRGLERPDPPTASARTPIVVFVVQSGNPKDIQTWDDLVQDGVSIVTPDPGSSGAAKWNLLAAYGSALAGGGTEDDALDYVTHLVGNVATFPGSGRDATTAFTERHRRRPPLLRERGDPGHPGRRRLRVRRARLARC